MSVVLRPVDRAAAQAVAAGRRPAGVEAASDYPTEFSVEVAEIALRAPSRPPSFIVADGIVVGEIGAHRVDDATMEVGYAIVRSRWGRGLATAAVRALLDELRDEGVERVVAHAPLDRPGSGRVLEKAGFRAGPERDEEHDGVTMRVRRWELAL